MNKEEMEKKIFELICVNEQLQQENKQLKGKIKELEEYKWKYEELCK